jgi:predicted small metal-binding protein
MNCTFETSAPTEKEILSGIGVHLSVVHNIKTMTPQMRAKVGKAIKK